MKEVKEKWENVRVRERRKGVKLRRTNPNKVITDTKDKGNRLAYRQSK